MPFPNRPTAKLGLDASDAIAMVPLAPAAEVGAKSTVKVRLSPARKACGKVSPLTLKPEPEVFASDSVIVEVLRFVKVSEPVSLPPTCTSPKLIVAGLASRA